MGFFASKTVLSAVELELFTQLGNESTAGRELGRRLGLHQRGIDDFLDALVALGFLERDGDGAGAMYPNTAETAAFLDKTKPAYIGGILEMANARLYKFWGDLTAGLKTGQPQNEVKHTGTAMFEELYSDPARLEQFMGAMAGISAGNFHALAEKVDFSRYKTVCDVGGGDRSAVVDPRHRAIRTCGAPASTCRRSRRSPRRRSPLPGSAIACTVAVGRLLQRPAAQADVITMGMILHDWNLEKKMHLIRGGVRRAARGRGVHRDREPDRRRAARERVRAADVAEHADRVRRRVRLHRRGLRRVVPEVGFRDVKIIPLAGPASAGIAIK